MNPWKVILATMTIFVCGAITGALIVKTTQRAPEPAPAITAIPAVVAANTASNAPPPSRPNPGSLAFGPMQAQAQRAALLRQMVNRLRLDPRQRDHIMQIIKDSQDRNRVLWNTIAPQMRDEMQRVIADIRNELDGPQRNRFNQLLRENRRPNGPAGPVATNAPAPAPGKSSS